MKYKIEIPLDNEFKTWLLEEGITKTEKSASSYISRLRRLFSVILDKFFPKKISSVKIRLFHEIFKDLNKQDMTKAAELLDAMRELAFDKQWSNYRTKIKVKPYGDCRTALERYVEFYCQSIGPRNTNISLSPKEIDAIEKTIKKYQKKGFTKDELYKNIIFRRRTEGRYTGDVFYPIELIDRIYNIEKWLTLLVDKIQILIDKNGQSITFKKLRDNDFALKIEKRKVFIYQQNGKDWEQVYTHTDIPCEIKPMNVAIFQGIDIDHKVAISNMLKEKNYPALAELTKLIKKEANFPQKGKTEQVKFLRGTFYSNNQKNLTNMVDDIKKDLEELLNDIEFEMMDGHANKRKSNK